MNYSKDDLPEVKRLLIDPHKGYIVHYVKYNKTRNIMKDLIEYLVLIFGIGWWLLKLITNLANKLFWSMYTLQEINYIQNSFKLAS